MPLKSKKSEELETPKMTLARAEEFMGRVARWKSTGSEANDGALDMVCVCHCTTDAGKTNDGGGSSIGAWTTHGADAVSLEAPKPPANTGASTAHHRRPQRIQCVPLRKRPTPKPPDLDLEK
jgi:hypothetical protein